MFVLSVSIRRCFGVGSKRLFSSIICCLFGRNIRVGLVDFRLRCGNAPLVGRGRSPGVGESPDLSFNSGCPPRGLVLVEGSDRNSDCCTDHVGLQGALNLQHLARSWAP